MDEQEISFETGFLLAISGGVDSIVLVNIFGATGAQGIVAHVNYNLRADSGLDAELVRKASADKDLHCIVEEIPASHWVNFKGNIQVEARRLRYAFFEKLQLQYGLSVLVTAHHADDATESFFINLLRGSGIAGLSGWDIFKNQRFRPLLEFSKAEIVAYAQKWKLEWNEDSSNSTAKYLRNRLRNELIPLLVEMDPREGAGIKRTMAHIRTTQDALSTAYDDWREKAVTPIANGFAVTWKSFKEQYFVNAFLAHYGHVHPNELYLFMGLDGRRFFINVGEGKAERTENGMLFYPNFKLLPPVNLVFEKHYFSDDVYGYFQFNLLERGRRPQTFDGSIYLDFDLLPNEMSLRSIAAGDRFQPLGMSGTKKVNDYLSDKKVGHLEKQKTLVLWAHQKIAAVLPYQIDEAFRLTAGTKHVLQIKTFSHSTT